MRVLIVGAGIAGLSLALGLKQRGVTSLVLERAAGMRRGGYMIDFFGPGYDAAAALGLLPDLAAVHYQIPRLRFVDFRGRLRYALAYSALRRLLDNRHFNFLRGDLEQVLYDHVRDSVEVRFDTTIQSFSQDADSVQVRLSDGATEAADVLVGADGIHSAIRAQAFGPEAQFLRYLGHHTAAYFMPDSPPIRVPRDSFTTLTEPGRQVAIYPVRGARLATFFVYHAPGPAADTSCAAGLAALRRVYGDLDWVVPRVLAAGADAVDFYFDSVSQVVMPAWSRGRITLVGDAAWCLSLLAGQGASMAVAGGAALAEELAQEGTDVAVALARYEARICPEVLSRQAAGRRMATWFVPRTRWQLTIRDLVTRFAVWPGVSALVKRTLAAGSKV